MHHFQFKDKALHCEELAIEDIVEIVGTPLYVYSSATITRHFAEFEKGFAGIDHLTCFAVKACSNIAILNLLAQQGAGADIVSGGELFRALKAGIPAEKIVFSGVGKTAYEMREAIFAGIRFFNVESAQELDKLETVAAELGTKARVSFRVNPDVDPKTHPYIATGLAQSKFGLPMEEAYRQYKRAASMEHIEVVGISCHIGSQLTEISPFVAALQKIRAMYERLRQEGIILQFMDIGGGIGVTYDQEDPPHPLEYAKAVTAELGGLDCTFVFEPGRVIVANSGILVTSVLYTKTNPGNANDPAKTFVVVDAAMNDLSRPSLYGAHHTILGVRESKGEKQTVDVVGPICESGDFIARNRELGPVQQGDLLAVMSSGAYGFSMSSNYNSRPRAAEVLVRNDCYQIIRKREDYDDLIRGETLLDENF
ncbi:diaminopimelate decarboxylase [Desulfogranum japonicum]|uniref:diaminopimelate decarboxylase n=1 Tax=Desulfogranum japonicum TaxID=231447 RepID=UPI0003FE2889|nr:diaminopimelate decarboxylase [Desulfogranum japonicum]